MSFCQPMRPSQISDLVSLAFHKGNDRRSAAFLASRVSEYGQEGDKAGNLTAPNKSEFLELTVFGNRTKHFLKSVLFFIPPVARLPN